MNGPREMQALLHQVSAKMLEAIIRNTIPYNEQLDEGFRKEQYEMDNCPGSYIVIAIRTGGGGFTAEEYRKVYDLGMMYYCKDNALWSDKEWRNAARLDISIRRAGQKLDTIIEEIKRDPAKSLALKFDKADLFLHNLKNRTITNEVGVIQMSTPCYVWCIVTMKARTTMHDTLHSMQKSNRPLAFFASKLCSYIYALKPD
jgi:hypothetical protein